MVTGGDCKSSAKATGGFSFVVDEWGQLTRFLILGSEGGTYYVSEQKLTKDNLKVVEALVNRSAADGKRVVDTLLDVSVSGRASKQSPTLAALAMAASSSHAEVRAYALSKLNAIARTGTHLFEFVAYVDAMRGWGRALTRAVSDWYNLQTPEDVAYQAMKYQGRKVAGSGRQWTHRDVFRLAHIQRNYAAAYRTVARAEEVHMSHSRQEVYRWIVNGWTNKDGVYNPPMARDEHILAHPGSNPINRLLAVELLKRADSRAVVVGMINAYNLPREVVPTQWLTDPYVWEALLEKMPMTAMLRNFATMTRVGLLAPMSNALSHVLKQWGDGDRITKSRVHPIAILSAMMTYKAGRGLRGKHTWTPIGQVVDALDEAFYLAFGNVVPTGKKQVLAIDVSGSMESGNVGGVIGLSPRMAAGAMALVTASVEKPGNYAFMGFSDRFIPLDISPKMRLDAVMAVMDGLPFAATDCALPMLWAMGYRERNVSNGHWSTRREMYRDGTKALMEVDAFIVYTDSETQYGNIHPHKALEDYRKESKRDAKLVVVGMEANSFTIANPRDKNMLDVVGFDSSVPQLISSFVTGNIGETVAVPDDSDDSDD